MGSTMQTQFFFAFALPAVQHIVESYINKKIAFVAFLNTAYKSSGV